MSTRPMIIMIQSTQVSAQGLREALPAYVHALLDAGAFPLALPFTDVAADITTLLGRADGILLMGGGDIAPACYGEELQGSLNIVDVRDTFEGLVVPLILATGKPVLGICRGLQSLNVFAPEGGTLVQDMATPHPRQHEVTISGGRMAALYGQRTFTVNSFHHQAAKRLARGFVATATAFDGTVEAIELVDHPYAVGVQWHPERTYPDNAEARHLIKDFVATCQARLPTR